jgi:cell division protein FtsB
MIRRMVANTRRRTVLALTALYVIATALIGYFGSQAYSGSRGLKAQQDLAQQLAALSSEIAQLKAQRSDWERRVALLRPESLDPDMLDERARTMLDYVHSRDLIFSAKAAPLDPPVTGSIQSRTR